MTEPIDILQSLIRAAMDGAEPARAVNRALLRWEGAPPTHMLAVGKASIGMAAAAIKACDGVSECLVVGPDVTIPEPLCNPRVRVLVADHPLPTPRNVAAAHEVLRFVSTLPKRANLLVLLSGGASAHLALPIDGVTLDDIREVTGELNRAGATIHELNTVRKHCEQLKGGRLAAACTAKEIRVLVMSDVEGDRLDVIGSGPFAPDTTTRADAMAVLKKYVARASSPCLSPLLKIMGRMPMPQEHGQDARATHEIIANNRTVLDAVAAEAQRQALFVIRSHPWISGDAAAAGARIANLARASSLCSSNWCLIAGGEPIVNVGSATGLGGPSQELALAAALALEDAPIMLAAISTDGVDGPTPHMGAIATGHTASTARERGLDPEAVLANHDSATFFAATHGALPGGPSGTNLNHVVIAVG
ncbi:MAG: DUF4147 domain-containing protein [Planctomycetota bacterium]